MQLNELRKELAFNAELLNLVETLKNVAGSQYHMMEKEKERFGRFLDAFAGFFRVVDLVGVENPLVESSCPVRGIVIVTSDSGFMGGLNQGVLRKAEAVRGDLPEEQVSRVVLGDKGATACEDAGWRFKAFPGIDREALYEQAVAVREYIVEEVLAGRMGKTQVVYPRPLSFSAQTIDVVDLLPCAELFDRAADSEVSRRAGRRGLVADARKVIVESSFSDIAEYLSSVWLTGKLYEVFEDSKLAEFSARAMHLEGSQQKVEKEHKKLKHRCFKASHEQIDKGMRESFAAKGGQRKRKQRTAAAARRRADGVAAQ